MLWGTYCLKIITFMVAENKSLLNAFFSGEIQTWTNMLGTNLFNLPVGEMDKVSFRGDRLFTDFFFWVYALCLLDMDSSLKDERV